MTPLLAVVGYTMPSPCAVTAPANSAALVKNPRTVDGIANVSAPNATNVDRDQVVQDNEVNMGRKQGQHNLQYSASTTSKGT